MAHVIRSFERPSRADIEAIGKFSPATIHEAQGKLGAIDARIKPIQPGLQLCGPAITAKCHIGDNLMIFEAINLAQPGDVLVVSAGDNPDQGGFGDVLAAACIGKGIAGLVIDAGVRDIRDLTAMGFPVWSKAISAQGTVKETLGSVNVPVVCAGALVEAGDVIVADDDGVCVVRRAEAEEVANTAEKRLAAEEAKRKRLAAGELGLDIYDMRPRLAEKGLKYV